MYPGRLLVGWAWSQVAFSIFVDISQSGNISTTALYITKFIWSLVLIILTSVYERRVIRKKHREELERFQAKVASDVNSLSDSGASQSKA